MNTHATTTSIRERPILFTGAMVCAILGGRKTQTRRLLKLESIDYQSALIRPHPSVLDEFLIEKWPKQERSFGNFGRCENITCPYGKPGDRLWVRETWAPRLKDGKIDPNARYVKYRADGNPARSPCDEMDWHNWGAKWHPSIFLPRWASRITLEITGVRVERVQEISEADARAEGAMFFDGRPINHHGWRHDYHDVFPTARHSFAHLWESINRKKAPWSSNPWCWVIEFKIIKIGSIERHFITPKRAVNG